MVPAAAATMPEYLEEMEVAVAARLQRAISQALERRVLTPDLGGEATTEEVTQAVIEGLLQRYGSESQANLASPAFLC